VLYGHVAEALRQSSVQALPLPAPLAALGLNPLRGVLEGLLDTSAFGRPGAPALVVSATRVRTGEARLFRDAEVTADVPLASACLPQVFPPVEIEGELYWDGGYASNPPLRPLIEAGAPADVILVRTAPLERPEPPHGAADVRERAAEIAFGTRPCARSCARWRWRSGWWRSCPSRLPPAPGWRGCARPGCT